jgi:flagellin-like protein
MRYTETTQDDDAVSPVIGVILMVAITVILAAVIGTFVLGLGEQVEQNARAGINADVDNTEDTVTMSVTTLDNSDYVVVRGINNLDWIDGPTNTSIGSNEYVYLDTTGTSITLGSSGSGTLTIVAVIGDSPGSSPSNGDLFASGTPVPESATQTTVQQVDYDFT